MKHTPIFTLFLAAGLIAATSSCKSSQESVAQRKSDIKESMEPTQNCFVQMKDGSIKNYKSLRIVTGMLKAPYLLADENIKIETKNITAYQTKEHFAISQDMFKSGRKSYVATEALPGFAIRIAKGKINVFTKKYFNGTVTVDEYFLQKGNDGAIVACTAENMNEMVKDDDEALAFFLNKKYNTSKTRKEFSGIALAKRDKVITKNK